MLPPKGWHKEKFDYVEKGNSGPLGCGGIIRNYYGVSNASLAYPLGYQTNHYVEASTTLLMVKLAFDMGV